MMDPVKNSDQAVRADQALRRRILARRDALGGHERQQLSEQLCTRLPAEPLFSRCGTVMVYVHFRSEVQTNRIIEQLLAQGREVAVPLTLAREKRLLAVRITDPEQQLSPGYCGIPEPRPELLADQVLEPGQLDAVLVPGSVFDEQGGRMGYGGGFYDRFLAREAPAALRIGLAFDLQVLPRLQLAPHDQPLDLIVTPSRTLAGVLTSQDERKVS